VHKEKSKCLINIVKGLIMKRRKQIFSFFLIVLIFVSTHFVKADEEIIEKPIVTLNLAIDKHSFEYAEYMTRNLEDIGIDVKIINEGFRIIEPVTYPWYRFEDWDLGFLMISEENDPDLSYLYSENGSLNLFGLGSNISYCEENERFLKKGIELMNFEERQQHYYEWQQLLMDKIVPILPFYSPYQYISYWSNLKGYDASWGIVNSLPYMEFDGLHEEQNTTDELNIHDCKWSVLNPLLQADFASAFISSLVMEPLLQINPRFGLLKTGLIVDWKQDIVNENLFKFTLRNDIYWNPSYNITNRIEVSAPLNLTTTPLMVGFKGGYSNGTNQQVTAKDAVFTLLAWSNPLVSEAADDYKWLHDIWIDSVDPFSFWIEIDGNPATPELESYAPFWNKLTISLLPEFFLNSTNNTVTYSSGNVSMVGIYDGILETPQWKTFDMSAFGCGKYMLDYSDHNTITVLQKSPYWMGIGAIDGSPQDLDISTINVHVIPDQTSAFVKFKIGKLDLMDITSFPSELHSMIELPFVVQTKLSSHMLFMVFNLRKPFIGGEDNNRFLNKTGYENYTKALAVRKAICYAIDREKINNVFHDGRYFITDSPVPPYLSYWYYNNITKYHYNLQKARDLLEFAGYNLNITNNLTFDFYLTLVGMFLLVSTVFKRKFKLKIKKERRGFDH